MPDYGSNPGSGSDPNYSDADSETQSAAPSKDGDSEQGETALIPKSLCPDMKPGDEVVLKIVRGLDDDWEVAYAPKKKEEESSAPEPAQAPSGDSEMASMME